MYTTIGIGGGMDPDACTVAQPRCSFPSNQAFNQIRITAWDDGPANGTFGHVEMQGNPPQEVFVAGPDQNGNFTHYRASETEPGVVHLTATLDDIPTAIDPANGQQITTADDPPGSTNPNSGFLTVWEFDITSLDPAWRPTLNAVVAFTAQIRPATDHNGNNMAAVINFTLSSSTEPGYCMNGGAQADNDLLFPTPQNGFTIDPPQGTTQQAHTVNAVLNAAINVTCLDYGAHGTIGAMTNIGGQQAGARRRVQNPNPPPDTIVLLDRFGAGIPVDDDPANCIADGTTWNGGPAAQDTDANPSGDGTNGDGISRYEEYRGFVMGGNWAATDPTQKDVFVYDVDGIGLGDFPALGPTAHIVTGNEWSGGGTRIINFNAATAHLMDQHAIQLDDAGYSPYYYGRCYYTLPDAPLAYVYSEAIREDGPPINSRTIWDPADTEGMNRTIGHELGHGVNIPGDHRAGTTTNCVEFEPLNFAAVPHVFCTTNPGCQNQWRLRN